MPNLLLHMLDLTAIDWPIPDHPDLDHFRFLFMKWCSLAWYVQQEQEHE